MPVSEDNVAMTAIDFRMQAGNCSIMIRRQRPFRTSN